MIEIMVATKTVMTPITYSNEMWFESIIRARDSDKVKVFLKQHVNNGK